MKISVWVFVSDVISTRQTLIERTIDFFDKKHSMFYSMPHEYIFRSLKQAGIDGIELLIPLHTSDENIKQVKKIISKNNMPVLSIHQSLSNRNAISFTEIERLCSIANIFYATIVVLHSKTLGNKLFDSHFIASLKKLQKKYRITFGVENMEKSLFTTQPFTYKGKDFSSVIKKAGLFMTFDTTHLAQAREDIISFYLANRERIINIHLSDYKKTWLNTHVVSQTHTHLALRKGELPIEKFLKTLKKDKYKGLITLEVNAHLSQLCESAKIIKQYMR